ncbi:MAG: hypothetical protein EON90_00480 [Brevundimonas sp.]|nr:MAG: hypothetical protein EON90_00480 [Brevundimonas sp.]
MRISFPDTARPRQAAKNLSRVSPTKKLSEIQSVLAATLGYRDWYELTAARGSPVALAPTSPDALRIVGAVADALNISDTDALYALSKARLLAPKPWSMTEQLELQARLWRLRLFSGSKRGHAGTVVRDRGHGGDARAYLVSEGGLSRILLDTGLAHRASSELITPRKPLPDFVPARLWEPYGYWTLADGSEVLFSRDYFPLWRIANDIVERMEPWWWIDWTSQQYFTTASAAARWATGLTRDLAVAKLEKARIFELPKLVGAMPHIFAPGIEGFEQAVSKLGAATASTRALPTYARPNQLLRSDSRP